MAGIKILEQPEIALKKYFGYDSFRPNQKEIIESILGGGQVVAILPTGAGKSLCYQIPALAAENFSIVISPLIALMKDQVDSLNTQTEIAAFINSTMSFYEAEAVLAKIAEGKIKLLYVAPERLESIDFADRIKTLNPSFLFVDEAHCISEWGHNFRPSYGKIKEFADYAGIKHVAAFTATATPEVQNDIVKQLGLKDPQLFVRGFERENLSLNVEITKKKNEKCFELISRFKTPAIIYTSSRKKAEEVSEFLNLRKIVCEYYHAGLAPEQRKKIQEDFLNDKIPVIAATNAFGMGIDKKDIRLVIHYNTPGSIENYYQEVGRAGRDGKPSFAFLLHDESDIGIQNFFLSNSHPDKILIQKVYDAVCDYGRVAEGNIAEKEIPLNHDYIFSAAGKEVNRGLLHSVLRILENAGYMKLLSEFERKATVIINADKNRLKEFIMKSADISMRETLLFLLREHGSEIFGRALPVNVSQIASSLELRNNEVDETLALLDNIGIITYDRPAAKENILMISPRVNSGRLRLDYKKINESYIYQKKKIESMVDYAFTGHCRFRFILKYFGEDAGSYKCGRCDKCTAGQHMPESLVAYLKEIILRTAASANFPLSEAKLISVVKGSSKEEIFTAIETFGACAGYDRSDLKTIVRELVNEGLLTKESDGSNIIKLTASGASLLSAQGLMPEPVKTESGYSENLELFNILREVRNKASRRFMQTGYLICPDEVLREVAQRKPSSRSQMLVIPGFNTRMFNKLGNELLEAVSQFLKGKETRKDDPGEERKIPSNIKETYNLLRKGYILKDIASLRGLTQAVVSMQIETILEYMPDTEVSFLFADVPLEIIYTEIEKGYKDLKELKERLPDNATYPLIRIAAAKYKSSSRSSSSIHRRML